VQPKDYRDQTGLQTIIVGLFPPIPVLRITTSLHVSTATTALMMVLLTDRVFGKLAPIVMD